MDLFVLASGGSLRRRVQAACNALVSVISVRLDELAEGEVGVQNPPAPAKKKAIRVSEWLFSTKSVLTNGINPTNVG